MVDNSRFFLLFEILKCVASLRSSGDKMYPPGLHFFFPIYVSLSQISVRGYMAFAPNSHRKSRRHSIGIVRIVCGYTRRPPPRRFTVSTSIDSLAKHARPGRPPLPCQNQTRASFTTAFRHDGFDQPCLFVPFGGYMELLLFTDKCRGWEFDNRR